MHFSTHADLDCFHSTTDLLIKINNYLSVAITNRHFWVLDNSATFNTAYQPPPPTSPPHTLFPWLPPTSLAILSRVSLGLFFLPLNWIPQHSFLLLYSSSRWSYSVEQHEAELRRSTYARIFFSSKYHSTTQFAVRGIWGYEGTMYTKGQLEVTLKFSIAWRVGAPNPCTVQESTVGTSLVVQWLKNLLSNAGDVGSIPGWRTKIPTCHKTTKPAHHNCWAQALWSLHAATKIPHAPTKDPTCPKEDPTRRNQDLTQPNKLIN